MAPHTPHSAAPHLSDALAKRAARAPRRSLAAMRSRYDRTECRLSVAGGVTPSGAGGVASSAAGGVASSVAGGVVPSVAGGVVPSVAGGVLPSVAGGVAPSGMRGVASSGTARGWCNYLTVVVGLSNNDATTAPGTRCGPDASAYRPHVRQRCRTAGAPIGTRHTPVAGCVAVGTRRAGAPRVWGARTYGGCGLSVLHRRRRRRRDGAGHARVYAEACRHARRRDRVVRPPVGR